MKYICIPSNKAPKDLEERLEELRKDERVRYVITALKILRMLELHGLKDDLGYLLASRDPQLLKDIIDIVDSYRREERALRWVLE